MRRQLLCSIVATFLSGCVAPGSEWAPPPAPVGQPVTLTASEQAQVEEAIKYDLKDPTSAMFRNFRAARTQMGTHVCGEVNSKNGFGGYTGFTAFYGTIRKPANRFGLVMVESRTVRGGDIADACARVGAV